MDDQRLIRRILDGDERAFEQLLEEYQDRVYRLACRMVGTRDAEDVTQEAFVAVYKSLASFGGRARLSTWVYRVAINACLMWKRRRRTEEISWDETMEVRDTHCDVEMEVIRSFDFQHVESALEKLDEGHRLVVVLHELQGLTYKEIASAMDIPVGTVKSRLFNAIQRLRRLLTDVTAEAT